MQKLTAEEKQTLKTYNKMAAVWSNAHLEKDYWLKEMTLFNEYLPKGKILDVGAGGGRDARELIDLGYKYVGTDISEGLLEEARKNNPGAIFHQVSLYDLNFGPIFDGFWCAAVLLHIPRDRIDQALESIKSNMKPGAVGFIAVKEGKGDEIQYDLGKENSRYFIYWQKASFKKVLTRNGYKILEEGYKPMSESTKWLTYIVRI